MDGSKMLSGSILVAKGATKKVDGQLPEVGLKDVTPNGSWLEQKQIQSALEARKQLIAVERIEKSGSLSHAEWKDDLKLAEVTKQTGGHWQYIGQQAGKCMYLLPEEVLFLMETNSLLLKHNDVTVSLQKAYALCLNQMPMIQYRVYASLARLGYRVFRHKIPTAPDSDKHKANEGTASNCMENHPEIGQSTQETNSKCAIKHPKNNTDTIETDDLEHDENGTSHATVKANYNQNNQVTAENRNGMMLEDYINDTENMSRTVNNANNTKKTLELTTKITRPISNIVTEPEMDVDDNSNEATVKSNDNKNSATRSHKSAANTTGSGEISHGNKIADVYSIDGSGVIREFQKQSLIKMDTDDCNVTNANINTEASEDSRISDSFNHYVTELNYYDTKIKKLTERKITREHSKQSLNTMLDFYKLLEVNVKSPDEKYLPRNIFLHKTDYTLNIETIRTQNASNINEETDSLGSTTPANGMDSQRLTNVSHYSTFNSIRPRYPNYRHRPYHNHRMNFHYMYRGMPHFHTPRYHPNSFVRPQYMVFNVNMPRFTLNNQPNSAAIRKYHYDMIVNIAMRFKSGLALPAQVRALINLVNTYNLRYNTSIALTPDFNIVGRPEVEPELDQNANENVITLDDEPKPKKRRLNNDTANYNNNLTKLKQLAAKLKMLHAKNLAVSRHRRVFSNAIKTFNKSFNADVHMDANFVLEDRKTVVLDTSSDSDAVIVTEQDKPKKKRKKLRNPFNILRRMGKDVNVGASTSHIAAVPTITVNLINDSTTSTNNAKSLTIKDDRVEELLIRLYKCRFPGNDEFGGPKLCSRVNAHLDTVIFKIDCKDVLTESVTEFKSWTDIKIAILKSVTGNLNLQKQQVEALSNDFFTTESQIQPILKLDCRDLKSALKQLAIIPTNKEVTAESNLAIHFDVCNRDVHFKKSNPPKPNFRVVCYDESAIFPSSTQDVVALQDKYRDGVPIVFAFVGNSAAISYLQINSIELPVFIPEGLAYE